MRIKSNLIYARLNLSDGRDLAEEIVVSYYVEESKSLVIEKVECLGEDITNLIKPCSLESLIGEVSDLIAGDEECGMDVHLRNTNG